MKSTVYGWSAASGAGLLLALSAAVPASAQATSETVFVTGSRIASPDAASANPITVVTPEVYNRTAATSVEQVVRKIPSIDFTGGTSGNTNNNGFGASQVGMRNLTPARTLVLVNGQRFPYTDTPVPAGGVDLGNIPLPMLNRVEVLRDGASSIYGADAIAGVINLITKTDFQGVSINAEYGTTDKWDGQRWGVGALMGANFDKGNIMVFLGTDNRSPIWQSDRKWSAATYVGTIREGAGSTSGRLTGLTGTVAGVGNIQFYTPQGYVSPSQPGYVLSNAVSTINPLPADWVLLPGTANQLGVTSAPRLAYSFVKHQYLEGYNHKKTADFIGHYEIFPDVTALAEAFFTVRDSGEQLSPDPIGYNITTLKYGGLMIPALLPDGTDNPYNPFPNPITNALYRPSNGPARLYRDNVSTLRFRFGLEGHLFEDYDWRVGYQTGQSDAVYRVTGSTNFDHLSKLSGQVACGSDVRIGCSVANFTGINTLTPTQLNYLFYTNTRNAQTSQSLFYGSISGPIIELPAGPLAFAVGGEHRQESGFDKPDSIVLQGDGNADAQATQGHYTITSAYGELNVPILKGEWFAESLTASLSGRYDSTSSFGEAKTYKFGIDYAITEDVRLRGSQSTGFRAPQIKELYGGAFQSFPQGNDPCKANGPGAFYNKPNCIRDLTAAGVDPATFTDTNVQFRTINGGNPNLQAETSRSQSLGLVLTPRWVEGFSFNFDYYRIFIKGPISAVSPQQAANNCYNPAISLQSACALITRQQGTGAIIQVLATNLNTGSWEVKGFDFGADYSFPTTAVGLPEWGGFVLNLNANMQDNFIMTDVAGTKTEMAGHYATGAFGAQPRLKYTLNMTFNSDDGWSFNWISRYVGHLENVDKTTYRPASVCANNCGDYLGNFSNGFFYHDISATYQWRNIGVTVGVDNLFDKDPPFLSDLFTNSITSGPFDYTGRYVYGKLKLDL